MRLKRYRFWLPLLLLGGCHEAQDYPSATGSVLINDRGCCYDYTDYQIQHAIVFNDKLEITSGTFSGRELKFQTLTRRNFSMKYAGPDRIVIDGTEFSLKDGAVFLVELGREGNRCKQVPVSFARRASPTADIEGHVRDQLTQAAEEHAELHSFLGLQAAE